MHSLEYFNNGKLRRHRLKLNDPDQYYQLIENSGAQEEDAMPSKTPHLIVYKVLHPDQNLFETNIVNFILQIRDKSAVIKRQIGSDDQESEPSNDSDWLAAGTRRSYKTKVKATYNLHGA